MFNRNWGGEEAFSCWQLAFSRIVLRSITKVWHERPKWLSEGKSDYSIDFIHFCTNLYLEVIRVLFVE